MTPVRPLDRLAVLLIVALCGMWALQQVAVKIALPDIPALTQAGLRAAVATVVVGIYGWRATPRFFAADRTLAPGLLAGLLFGAEFVLLFLALTMTTAGRATLFLYTAPFFLALGLHWLLPTERLGRLQWLGLVLSFIGVAMALGAAGGGPGASLSGDLCALAAGAVWAATTLVVKSSPLRTAPPVKTLLYQLAVSAVVLGVAAFVRGERIAHLPGAAATWSLLYQTLVVVCFSYLAWFVMIVRYRAGELSAFTFLTPVFGVLAGWAILGEALTPGFALSVALVAAGIVMVNWPARPAA